MGQVINISSQTVDDAWDRYVEFARMLSADGDKLHDRQFHEEFQRRYMRWANLFRATVTK